MFTTWATRVLGLLVLAGAGVGVVVACGGYGDLPATMKLPGGVQRGIVVHNQFFAVTDNGKLIKADLRRRRVTDLGCTIPKLAPFVDVSGGKALVASPGKAHVIDVAGGKTERSVSFAGETIFGLGLIGSQRAFVHTGPTVVFLDLAAGTTLSTVTLGPTSKTPAWHGREWRGCERVGQRLYASNGVVSGLSIIDLDKGKLVEQIKEHRGGIGNVCVVGGKALMLGSNFSYGVRVDSVGEIDLKTKKYTPRRLSAMTSLSSSLLAAPDGTLYFVEANQAHRYEASGKLTALLPAKEPGRLIGFWSGNGLVVSGQQMRVVALPKSPTRALWLSK